MHAVTPTTTHLRQLTRLGAYLEQQYNKYHKALLKSAQINPDNTAIRQQGKAMIGRLLGNKAGRAESLLTTFVPAEKLDAWQNAIYENLAKFARQWAIHELTKDARFAQLDSLSQAARAAFATDIKHQNLALSALGGLTGFFGLKGVVVDTAWLLLISLKSVYQLSAIYQQNSQNPPDTTIAYAILSAMDLDKLQEKQMLMTALALGDTALKNAQQVGLMTALQNLSSSGYHSQSLGNITKHVDLDKLNKLNPKWLHWLLPLSASTISSYYNLGLMTQIFLATEAHFGSHQPLLLTNATATLEIK